MTSRRMLAFASVTLLASVTFAWAGLRSVYLPDSALQAITGGHEEAECNRSNTSCTECGIIDDIRFFKCTSANGYNECFDSQEDTSCGTCTEMLADCGQLLLCGFTGGCASCQDSGDTCAGCSAVEGSDSCSVP